MLARRGGTALLLALATNVILGTTFFASKFAVSGLPPVTVTAVRTLVAFACLVPFTGTSPLGAIARARPTVLGWLALMGIGGHALPILLGNLGIARSTATHAALLIGVEPLGMALLGALVLGEHLTRLRVLAITLGVAGAAAIVSAGAAPSDATPAAGATAAAHTTGNLLLVCGAAAWSLYSIGAKPIVARFPPLAVTAAALAISLPLLVPAAIVELAVTTPSAGWRAALLWTAALGAGASALGSVLWNATLQRMDASELAGFVFIQPLTGVLLGTLVLGDALHPAAVGGGALVLAGVYALALEERGRLREPRAGG